MNPLIFSTTIGTAALDGAIGATDIAAEQGERPDTDCFVPQFDQGADNSAEPAGSGCITPQFSIGPNE